MAGVTARLPERSDPGPLPEPVAAVLANERRTRPARNDERGRHPVLRRSPGATPGGPPARPDPWRRARRRRSGGGSDRPWPRRASGRRGRPARSRPDRPLAGHHRFRDNAADVAAWIRATGLDVPEVQIVGHSWGAMTAAALPIAGIRPATLVLLDPPAVPQALISTMASDPSELPHADLRGHRGRAGRPNPGWSPGDVGAKAEALHEVDLEAAPRDPPRQRRLGRWPGGPVRSGRGRHRHLADPRRPGGRRADPDRRGPRVRGADRAPTTCSPSPGATLAAADPPGRDDGGAPDRRSADALAGPRARSRAGRPRRSGRRTRHPVEVDGHPAIEEALPGARRRPRAAADRRRRTRRSSPSTLGVVNANPVPSPGCVVLVDDGVGQPDRRDGRSAACRSGARSSGPGRTARTATASRRSRRRRRSGGPSPDRTAR